jgi:hypothetical protein
MIRKGRKDTGPSDAFLTIVDNYDTVKEMTKSMRILD